MNDDELTPSERSSFDSLPRERIPNRGLEERTVRALRRRGFLHAPGRAGIVLSLPWTAVAAAAVIALVVGGFALGQWTGSRQTARAMLAMHEQDGLRLAAEVQRAGTAYVTALSVLAQDLEDQDPEAQAQGRQVALAALYAAADLVVSMAPDEPVAWNIRWALDQTARSQAESGPVSPKHFVWF